MLFKDAFKAKSYQKVFGIGYYTPVNGWTTIITRIGKQSSVSSLKVPTELFNQLNLDDNDKSITNLSDFPALVVSKDESTGFRKLDYRPSTTGSSDADED